MTTNTQDALRTEHPCKVGQGEFDHDWKFVDESFDHELGTQRIHYWRCEKCEEKRNMEPGDYDYDDY